MGTFRFWEQDGVTMQLGSVTAGDEVTFPWPLLPKDVEAL